MLTLDYPQTWKEFVGQELAKAQLRTAAKSARIRRAAADHVLLANPDPGVGKTGLALLFAQELGHQVHVVSGGLKLMEARLLFCNVNEHDVIVMDEIHRLVDGGKKNAEWMLHLLQDGVLMGPLGPEPVPSCTIVGTTTDAHRLPSPIISRFALQPVITPYTDDEGTKIAMIMARKLLDDSGFPLPTKRNCAQISQAANRNPRAIRQLLVALRDQVVTRQATFSNGYDLQIVYDALGLASDGLSSAAQRYLHLLYTEFTSGAGERSIRDRLGEPDIATTERLLLDKGLIAKTKVGRILTSAGLHRAKEIAA